jgi:hypothetical protein
MLADQGADLLRILLQRRSAPSTRHWFGSPVVAKALHPADGRTGADLKLFGRFTSRSSCLHEVNYANPQLTRIRSPHWLALRRINALDSLNRRSLGIPIHSGRDALLAQWYRGRTEHAPKARKTMIVALARKLLIALWRLVREGVVPEALSCARLDAPDDSFGSIRSNSTDRR